MPQQENDPKTRVERDPFRVLRPKPRERDQGGARDPWEGLAEVIDVPLERLRQDLALGRGGVALQGAEVRQINPGQAGNKVSGSAGRLMGWTFRELTGAGTALIYIRDGIDNTGLLVAVISLGARESARDNFGPAGLSIGAGLFVDVAQGSVEGALYLGGVD